MSELCDIGLWGLAVMGQNFALNMASHGFKVCVGNRTLSKVETTVQRAKAEGDLPLYGSWSVEEFVAKLSKPRKVVILVMAGNPVDEIIAKLAEHLEPGDVIIDGGNEWYPNSIRRAEGLQPKGIHFMGMGISGGEEGARYGPSLMPGGPKESYDSIAPIMKKCAAQVSDGPCVTYLGPIGAGNYVKMVHNGIEYGDMQLISEVYDILKVRWSLRNESLRYEISMLVLLREAIDSPWSFHSNSVVDSLKPMSCYASRKRIVCMTNQEMSETFTKWNEGELASYLIEITSKILAKKDDITGKGEVVDYVSTKSVQ